MIKFSIIIPCYNVEDYINNCLHSIFSQEVSSLEVIIVNDNSTDGTLYRIKESDFIDNIKLIDLSENLGPGNARNIGLANARGEYVLFLDGDDELYDDILVSLTKISDTQKPEIIVFNHQRFWDDGRKSVNKNTPLLEGLSKNSICNDLFKVKLFENFTVVWNKVYRKDFLEKSGFKFSSGYYEDIPFNYKSILKASSIVVIPDIGVNYRQRSGSILNSKSDKHAHIIGQFKDLLEYVYSQNFSKILTTKIESIFLDHVFHLLIVKRERLTHGTECFVMKEAKNMIIENNLVMPSSNKNKIQYIILKLNNTFCNRVLSFLVNLILKIKKSFK